MERRVTLKAGILLVLSSPSGAGKTTIVNALKQRDHHLIGSISVTTRSPRPGEMEGKDYYFKAPAQFETMVKKGEFLEHAQVFNHFYGTPISFVQEALARGKDVIFDIDWQGKQQIEKKMPHHLVSVFILPPSLQELEHRLRARKQDDEEVINKRMHQAKDEISHWCEYDYVFVNDNVEASIAKAQAILEAERTKRVRQEDQLKQLIQFHFSK